MTNTGGTPAGWYHAPGDADGTQRYWDGSQWIGEPQAVPQQAAPQPPAAPQAPQPPADTSGGQPPQFGASPSSGSEPPPAYGGAPGGQPPAYGSPPPGAGAPPGYQAFGAPGAAGSVGPPAEWGTRAIAYLIDIAPIFVGYVLIAIIDLISDTLGLILTLLFWVATLAYTIWNFYIVQGKTGQTIGKEKQGIKLVLDQTGEPVGAGMAFVRYLVSGAFVLLCCIGWVVNMLSPLWNEDKKTYSDKIMKMSVTTAD